ncbi:MAG: primosome assembly protein PriA [Candidatus Nanopelagicales bacterium]
MPTARPTGSARPRPAGRPGRSRAAGPGPLAEVDPVARVAVDVPLPHLDRPFDYAVPAALAADAVPGGRVRVRFAGRRVDGYVLQRLPVSDHPGRLEPLAAAVSPEVVLTPDVLALAREVADRYAGTLADVLRLAVPPRHARAESRPSPPAPGGAPGGTSPGAAASDAGRPPPADPGPWRDYLGGAALVQRVARPSADPAAGGRGEPGPRAVWSALPGGDPYAPLAHLVRAAADAGRGVLVVVPDARDLARCDAALTAGLGPDRHVTLSADLGPERRYRHFLALSRGAVRVALGTRAAAFAPVADLGLAVLWDDGDDLLAEPRAPYPHAREVLALRSHLTGCALVLGGYARTAEAQRLVDTGWARAVDPDRAVLRSRAPRVRTTGDDAAVARDPAARSARLPHLAWTTAREALADGPVLVQVPRAGYVPALACRRCRALARCAACAGPLAMATGDSVPACGWCGRPAGDWACPDCGDRRLRAVTVGSARTADELGRAFPGVPVRTSGGPHVLSDVGAEPALVVATPGAEPVASAGYAAVLLLDAAALLQRPGLRAGEEAVRRWMGAAALAAPGAPVVVTADPALRPVQALVRWDAGWYAARELEDRTAVGFPPARRMAALTGAGPAVADLLALARLPEGTRVLGPVPVPAPAGPGPAPDPADGPRVRALLTAALAEGSALATALREAAGVRSARRAPGPVEVRVDPVEIG